MCVFKFKLSLKKEHRCKLYVNSGTVSIMPFGKVVFLASTSALDLCEGALSWNGFLLFCGSVGKHYYRYGPRPKINKTGE